MTTKESVNYYELLQIPRDANEEAIRRAYRTSAARLHPDNPNSGDMEGFLLLQQAFRILSDPASRTKYDASLAAAAEEPVLLFELNRFTVSLTGEMKRRLALLALLYYRRRMEHERPGMTFLEIEKRLAFPREDLNFALWYLCSKGYMKREQNGSEYSLTVLGADYVEEHYRTAKPSMASC